MCSLILCVYDVIARIAADEIDPTKTCENQLFTGKAQWVNSISWLITRWIAGLSAPTVMLYLLWKRKADVILEFKRDSEQHGKLGRDVLLTPDLSEMGQSYLKSHSFVSS